MVQSKSTLMNVLYGIYDPDEGEILLDGKPVKFATAGDAVAAGWHGLPALHAGARLYGGRIGSPGI